METDPSTWPSTGWLDPRVVVGRSPIEGRGLFAAEPIAAGAVLMRLGGDLLTDDQFGAVRRATYSALAVGEGMHLLLSDDSPTTFGNHSCDSSLWLDDALTLTTRRPLGAGDEVTVDYALFTVDAGWSMPCRCGAEVCRGVVTGDDWRRPEVQARYAGHFSPFLNRRIALLRQEQGRRDGLGGTPH